MNLTSYYLNQECLRLFYNHVSFQLPPLATFEDNCRVKGKNNSTILLLELKRANLKIVYIWFLLNLLFFQEAQKRGENLQIE